MPALLDLLDAMQAGGVEDRIRSPAHTIDQALIDTELTAFIWCRPLGTK